MNDLLRPTRWGFKRSAAYGVLFGGVVAAMTLVTSYSQWSVGFWVQTILGQVAFGAVLFVVVSAIRNVVLQAR